MTQPCQIVADIGGTNARFARVPVGSRELQCISTLQGADFPQLIDAIRFYQRSLPASQVSTLCLAIAGPVDEDWIQFTNSSWSFSRMALQQALGYPVVAINDFSAQAYCLDLLQEEELDWLGPQRPPGNQMKAVLGPGTGLGMAGMTASGEVIESEGGHMAFAPVDAHEHELLKILWQRFERVSVERVLSGPGLSNLYWANSVLSGTAAELSPPEVTEGALRGDALCLQSVNNFLDILASVAGDLALLLGALDGVYLSGGILPKLTALVDRTRFRQRFAAKGRFQEYCEELPLVLVNAEHIGLRGCIAALEKGVGEKDSGKIQGKKQAIGEEGREKP